MSIWHKEVVRVNGRLMAYVEIQNEYTGATKGGLRDIHLDGNTYYCRADGQRINLNNDVEKAKMHEDKVKTALEWYNKTKF